MTAHRFTSSKNNGLLKYMDMKKDKKQKNSPKGKKKLEFGDKDKKRSKNPLQRKTIYLDLKDKKKLRQVAEDLRKLGAIIEEFLSKDVNYVITSQPIPKVGQVKNKFGSPDSPSIVSTPSPFNCGPSPSAGTGDNKSNSTVTRGQAMVQQAKIAIKGNSLLENAQKWGAKIVPFDAAVKWIQKELPKCPIKKSRENNKTEQKLQSKGKVCRLKQPCMKIEASSLHYRPVHQQMDCWPHINPDTPLGSCPFDGSIVGNGLKSQEERGDCGEGIRVPSLGVPSPFTANKQSAGASATPEPNPNMSMQGKSQKQSENTAAVYGGTHFVTVGELERRKQKKRIIERRKGYCECCQVKYADLDKHVMEDHHKTYVKDKRNYQLLDQMISVGHSTASFLQEILMHHCQEKNRKKDIPSKSETLPVIKNSGPSNQQNTRPKKFDKVDILQTVDSLEQEEAHLNTQANKSDKNRKNLPGNVKEIMADRKIEKTANIICKDMCADEFNVPCKGLKKPADISDQGVNKLRQICSIKLKTADQINAQAFSLDKSIHLPTNTFLEQKIKNNRSASVQNDGHGDVGIPTHIQTSWKSPKRDKKSKKTVQSDEQKQNCFDLKIPDVGKCRDKNFSKEVKNTKSVQKTFKDDGKKEHVANISSSQSQVDGSRSICETIPESCLKDSNSFNVSRVTRSHKNGTSPKKVTNIQECCYEMKNITIKPKISRKRNEMNEEYDSQVIEKTLSVPNCHGQIERQLNMEAGVTYDVEVRHIQEELRIDSKSTDKSSCSIDVISLDSKMRREENFNDIIAALSDIDSDTPWCFDDSGRLIVTQTVGERVKKRERKNLSLLETDSENTPSKMNVEITLLATPGKEKYLDFQNTPSESKLLTSGKKDNFNLSLLGKKLAVMPTESSNCRLRNATGLPKNKGKKLLSEDFFQASFTKEKTTGLSLQDIKNSKNLISSSASPYKPSRRCKEEALIKIAKVNTMLQSPQKSEESVHENEIRCSSKKHLDMYTFHGSPSTDKWSFERNSAGHEEKRVSSRPRHLEYDSRSLIENTNHQMCSGKTDDVQPLLPSGKKTSRKLKTLAKTRILSQSPQAKLGEIECGKDQKRPGSSNSPVFKSLRSPSNNRPFADRKLLKKCRMQLKRKEQHDSPVFKRVHKSSEINTKYLNKSCEDAVNLMNTDKGQNESCEENLAPMPDTPTSGYSRTPRGERCKWKEIHPQSKEMGGENDSSKIGERQNKYKQKLTFTTKTTGCNKNIEETENKYSLKSPNKCDVGIKSRPSKKNAHKISCEKNIDHLDKKGRLVGKREGKKNSFHLEWKSPGTLSKTKVKLNHSWPVLSNRSVIKLLASEMDAEPFEGFKPMDISGKTDLPTDVSYVELSEIEMAESEHELHIEKQATSEHDGSDCDVAQIYPDFSSPGKLSMSSWGDACEEYIHTSISQKLKPDSGIPDMDLYLPHSPTSCKRIMSCPRNRTTAHNREHLSAVHKTISVQCKRKRNKHDSGKEFATPKKQKNSGIEKIDDIKFNFNSPQKSRLGFIPLKFVNNEIISSPKPEKQKEQPQSQARRQRRL